MADGPSLPPPIPAFGGSTNTVETSNALEDAPHDGVPTAPTSTRTSSRRRNSVDCSETAKRPRIADCWFPAPDETLGDHTDSCFHSTEDLHPMSSSPSHAAGDRPVHGVDEDPPDLDMQRLATEAWDSAFASSSVAAVAPALPVPLIVDPVLPDEGQHPSLGRVVTITLEDQNNRVVCVPSDRSMARICRMCDEAGCPRYLPDALIKQLRREMTENNFNPCSAAITRRDAFMHRALKSTGTAPPEAIPITLESGQKVTVFRFPFKEMVQEHLLSDVFANLDNLSVNASNPWGFCTKDRSVLQDFHDGTFYPESCALFLRSKTNQEDCCFNPWIGYADRTHGDNTEKNSLEPFMLTSGIIRQWQKLVLCWLHS
jgi:hypothetical protein